ncbi:accessory gene regulator B family protein [Enterococcus faecalis]|uniref:accessory gene regulator B family protein n=1 Tax=Enterococcus TaxID=1350 RepID=UPI0003549A0D|nr:accessory gene regulator B family protein [Enterococcus faecalis]EGO2653252.1 hypothetical protein [Enterococcus faecalis]EGO2849260.1 hypothetical protein [Enterococcus faecalis]EGO5974476.1 hypothetical protein [Enterococcus faecalis]EGO6112880.1 hypothetical protein [Enterococcus faecalis]EGO6133556.1 hypothetical protein [Enterococcus faecalis]
MMKRWTIMLKKRELNYFTDEKKFFFDQFRYSREYEGILYTRGENKMEMKLSITELLAKQLLDKMTSEKELSRKEYLKCKLGLEIFLLNVTKLTVIYGIAFFLHSSLEVLIFHSAFMLIRFFAYGAHSSSSIACTIISSILFIGIPSVLHGVHFSSIDLLVVNLLNFLILLKYAPGKTKKNHVGNLNHQYRLRRNALLANTILVFGVFIPDVFVSSLLIFGGLLCGLLVTPLADKLLTLDLKF